MAASRVQFGNGQNSAGGSYGVNLPAGTGNGNLLVVCVGGFDPSYGEFVDLPNITDNMGSQYVVAADAEIGNDRLSIFYLPGVAAGVNALKIYQSFPSTCVAIEYAGLLNQVDVVSSPNTTTDTTAASWTAPTIVPSGSGVIVGFTVAITLVAAAFAAAAGYTLVVEQDDTVNGTSSAAFERLNAAALSPYNVNGTVGSATRIDSLAVAFK